MKNFTDKTDEEREGVKQRVFDAFECHEVDAIIRSTPEKLVNFIMKEREELREEMKLYTAYAVTTVVIITYILTSL